MPDTRIIIRPEVFGAGFDVVVEPSPTEPLDREFPTARDARSYASGLRLVHGWKVVDLADAPE